MNRVSSSLRCVPSYARKLRTGKPESFEAQEGIEPSHRSFADSRVSTSPLRQSYLKNSPIVSSHSRYFLDTAI